MGFSYRKSVKLGPFRMTASKSGVSYSVGVKGARVTKRANGKVQTTLSVPGTGLRYTATSGTKKPPAEAASHYSLLVREAGGSALRAGESSISGSRAKAYVGSADATRTKAHARVPSSARGTATAPG